MECKLIRNNKKIQKAHQLASLAGRGKVAGYENPRFYFVLNRNASALLFTGAPSRGLFDFEGLAPPQLGQTAFLRWGIAGIELFKTGLSRPDRDGTRSTFPLGTPPGL
jgi:hypothetical protein